MGQNGQIMTELSDTTSSHLVEFSIITHGHCLLCMVWTNQHQTQLLQKQQWPDDYWSSMMVPLVKLEISRADHASDYFVMPTPRATPYAPPGHATHVFHMYNIMWGKHMTH